MTKWNSSIHISWTSILYIVDSIIYSELLEMTVDFFFGAVHWNTQLNKQEFFLGSNNLNDCFNRGVILFNFPSWVPSSIIPTTVPPLGPFRRALKQVLQDLRGAQRDSEAVDGIEHGLATGREPGPSIGAADAAAGCWTTGWYQPHTR